MADTSFVIDILANVEKSVASIKGFANSVNKEVSQINKTFGSIGTLATGALAAIGVGFSLKRVIEEAANAEAEVDRFNLALQQTKVFTDQGSEAFQEFADTLQRQSGFAGGAILDVAANIQRFAGLSQKNLAVVTQATVDFAKFANVDLETAGQAVARALQGSEGALAKYGIQVKAGKNETEQLTNVLGALGIAQGASEKSTEKFATQIAVIKEEFNTLLESIGNAIIKNKDLAGVFLLVRSTLISVTKSIKNQESNLSNIVSAAVFLGKSLLGLGDIIYRVLISIVDIANVQLTTLTKVVVDLAAKVIKLFRAFGVGKDFLEGAQFSLEDFSVTLQGIRKAGADNIKKSLTDPILGFQTEVQKTDKSVKELLDKFDTKKGNAFGLKDDLKNLEKAQADKEKADVREQNDRDKIIKEQVKAAEEFRTKLIGVGTSLVGSIQQGAAGVTGALQGITSFAVDTLFPGFGALASSLLGFLAQGPEAVKAQIQAFIDNIPLIIDAIVASIPVVIEVLAANAPRIAIALSNQMPFVATNFAIELVKNIPNIAKGFIDGLIAEIGRLVTAIADGVKGAIGQATGLGGGGILGKVINPVASIGKKLKFADGGVIPGGFPNDTFPAQLTSGEGVVPNDTMRRLDQYLARADGGGGGSSGGGTTIIKLVVGEQELANVLLNLNRQGLRTS